MPLVLDLLRHGEAGAPGPGGDAMRALSPAGRESIARLAGRLAAEGSRPDRIFSSPLLRARQTAEMVRDAVPEAPAIECVEELLADCDPSEILGVLDAQGVSTGHVLLVTHQPLVGRLAALLTGEEPAFKAGTLVRIECAAAPGRDGGRVIRTIKPESGA